jgi:lipopolysaccharide heptosyltransferase II
LNPTKILLVQTAFIGDVIIITPLIRAIKGLYPNALLDVMVIPQTSNVLENNPHINNVIHFDKRKNKIISYIKTLTKLRKEKYNAVFTPHSSMTTAFLIYFARIPARVGFDRWKAKKYLTHKVPHLKDQHKTKKNLELLKPFTDKLFSIQTELFPSKPMQEKAIKLMSDFSKNENRTIAFAPGSVWFTKRWPIEHYIDLANKLLNDNYNIVLIGSKDEKEICNQIGEHKNLINLSGELSLLESAAIIDKCDLMICNDSGALHIANAMQIDVFAFFGPTVQRIGYYPFRDSDFVFELEMECRPCGSHGGASCPLKHHECMKLISPDQVFSKVKEKFN